MKSYAFLTTEGYTFQPGSDSEEPDIENCQLIGIGKGFSAEEALLDLITSDKNILETKFDKVFSMELGNDHQEVFFLSYYRTT